MRFMTLMAALGFISASLQFAEAETTPAMSTSASIEELFSFVSKGKRRVEVSLKECRLEIETRFLLGCKLPTFFDYETEKVNLRTVKNVTQEVVRGKYILRFEPYTKWHLFKGRTAIPVDYSYLGKICSGDLNGHSQQSSFHTFVPLEGREMLAASLNAYIEQHCAD